MLDATESSLIKARDDEGNPNVARVAAHAAILLLDKYHSLTDECEIYRIAIGLYLLHLHPRTCANFLQL